METRVGLVGWGTVGDGVVGILGQHAKDIADKTGVLLSLAKVADVDIERQRGHTVPASSLTTDYREILRDDSIRIVIELVGGTTVAKEVILGALAAGKHVVTANKALLASAGQEVFGAARSRGVGIGFEASVCGGIPLLAAIRHGLVANRITSLVGIVNGTTNYILCQMTKHGRSYADALKEAQALGFAEAAPSLDVDGWDACHKLTLLCVLAFQRWVPVQAISREGITGISVQDIQYAQDLGYVIKLLASARLGPLGLEVGVCPTLVPESHPLASVDGAFNAVEVVGDWVGKTLFYGLGAGSRATGSAVVSDLVTLASGIEGQGDAIPSIPSWSETHPELCPAERRQSKFYLRFSVVDQPGVLGRIALILGEEKISIASVIQKEGEAVVPVVIMTHLAEEGNLQRALRRIEQMEGVRDQTGVLRALGERES